jgi:hypothetical protein
MVVPPHREAPRANPAARQGAAAPGERSGRGRAEEPRVRPRVRGGSRTQGAEAQRAQGAQGAQGARRGAHGRQGVRSVRRGRWRPGEPGGLGRRRPGRLPLLALALAAVLLAAHQLRPAAPYGDHFTVHRRPAQGETEIRARGTAVEAYDPADGEARWRYARDGRRPLGVLPARGHTIAVWDDGLVTDTDGRSVRWHRALPAAAGWLSAHGAAGVLRPLPRGMLAVVTPHRIAAYRTVDGDLRWIVPAREGCAFRPDRAARYGANLLVAQPCAQGAWTDQLVAVDDLGPVAPHRTPLGNQVPGRGPVPADPEHSEDPGHPDLGHPDSGHPEKPLHRPVRLNPMAILLAH